MYIVVYELGKIISSLNSAWAVMYSPFLFLSLSLYTHMYIYTYYVVRVFSELWTSFLVCIGHGSDLQDVTTELHRVG